MSTIGVEKAFRDQDRAARRRGLDRTAGNGDLPEIEGSAPCASCGTVVPSGDLFFSDSGELCAACFGHEETALAPRSHPALVIAATAVRPMTVAVPAAMLWWVILTSTSMGLKGPVGLLVLGSGFACVGLFLSMVSIKETQRWARPDDEGHRPWAMVVLNGSASAVTVTATVACLVAGFAYGV